MLRFAVYIIHLIMNAGIRRKLPVYIHTAVAAAFKSGCESYLEIARVTGIYHIPREMNQNFANLYYSYDNIDVHGCDIDPPIYSLVLHAIYAI